MNHYQVTARNFSEASENRIHSDEIAKKFGFKGALVPGVAVYGYLTHPLVTQFGDAWLSQSVCDLRLLKPAYDGDRLALSLSVNDDQHTVHCHNDDGELLAILTSTTPKSPPAAEPASIFSQRAKSNGRIEISWNTVTPLEPFNDWTFTVTEEENALYTSQVADNLELYTSGVAHPHMLLSYANGALMHEYVMPTWIHVGSETRHRHRVNVGDTITVKSIPLEKWRKKGHEFIRLYVSYWRGEQLTTDILHTAIFKVAG
jgi:acyl dehydratase